ncbi:MAG: sigma 54-interacting transcriptional regulator [Fibrobacteria bacterium]|nr:sigma 54-interacting transcriptional regulator [Fibrobacteria bacterium]
MNNPDLNQDILSRVPCGILVLDDKQRVMYANPWVCRRTGISEHKLTGKGIKTVKLEVEQDETKSAQEFWKWGTETAQQARGSFHTGNQVGVPLTIKKHCDIKETGRKLIYISIHDCTQIENGRRRIPLETADIHVFHGLVGKSPSMQELFSLIELASGTGVNVVIQGQSGTGKELVASAIHTLSVRKNNPFIRVNCAALAETLLESELFGHVKGAFTGAYTDRTGNLEAAHKGTILLDEIGEISTNMQAKLLRVLQEKVIVRVGDNKEVAIDVRIVAATNRELRKLVAQGKFREDLFYRLNVFPIPLPALNERTSDIPLLCEHFIRKYNQEMGKQIQSISSDTMRLLMNYCWPGNVRELENTIEHAFVLCHTEEIQMLDLPHELRVKAVREGICAGRNADIIPPSYQTLAPMKTTGRRLNISKEELEKEIEKHGGNKSAAARALGISKVGLWKKMKKFEI